MNFKIQLSIQEIVSDFESLIRMDEKLKTRFDFEDCDGEDLLKYNDELTRLVKKYIPNYRKYLEVEDAESFEASLSIYEMLYENFKEIFYKLI
nr:hypothetical protein [uncultured Methanobrevibacter sp.]